MLVKLNNVTVSAVNDFDWSITDETGFEALIDDDMASFEADNFMGTLVEGQELDHVMGIFNYSFGINPHNITSFFFKFIGHLTIIASYV